MDFVILKDLRTRGLAAAGALLIAAACGGGGETGADAMATKNDSAAAPATAAAAAQATVQQPAAPGGQPAAPGAQPAAPVLDSAMTPAQAARAAAAAPAAGPVTTQALDTYQLTLPKLRLLAQAGQNMAALQARRPEVRDSMRIPTMDPNLLYQKLNSIPDAREAVTRAGLTPEEYVVVMAALLQATVVHEMRSRGQTPPGNFNERNAKFVGDNWEEIRTMMSGVGRPPSGPRQN
jgi:hypothetical protein